VERKREDNVKRRVKKEVLRKLIAYVPLMTRAAKKMKKKKNWRDTQTQAISKVISKAS
jgi:hypothetical protein